MRIRSDIEGVVVIPTEVGVPIILAAGDEIPEGVTVGPHLLEDSNEVEPAKPWRGRA